MEIPYRHTENIKTNQHTTAARGKHLDAHRVALLLLPENPRKPHWEQLPHGSILKRRFLAMKRRDKSRNRLTTDLPNRNATHTLIQAIDPAADTFEILTTARELAAAVREHDPAAVLVQVTGFASATSERLVESLVTALLSVACPMPSFKSEPAPAARLNRIEVYGLEEKTDLAAVRAEVIGNHLARWLSALPSSELTPTSYREFVKTLAGREGWQMNFLDTKTLARKKAGAFLAVAQASPVADAGIIRLRYRPPTRGGRRLALVGKGICFDTGGVNVKPARHMNGMHEDMQGSAVALGTLLALSRLETAHPVDCWLALAQNHIGSKAYKPNDVVTASNGTTIEVIHTDAEGRMVLADTLVQASKEKPHTLIDYATLTGACIYSLSSRYSGVFSNRPALHAPLIAAGQDSGERVWPFPLDKDFDESIKSTIADTKQCTLEGDADHILAARFLSRFVDTDINWIHVDLSASHHKGGLGHIPTDTTGFGVRFSLNLLRQQGVLEKTWN
ncbi:MAG: leucyl aminopeptidase family protein [Gammaproteobacteria bacterium]|nr:MAG: leucyl aminopeptidase family protein [Gammaproteobacteria bacterium]